MRPRLVLHALAFAALANGLSVACYHEDIPGPSGTGPLVKVLLTDAPFPFDSVARVNIYVDSIEAAASPDSETAEWVTVAAPHKAFDLLAVQQGTTAFVGQGTLTAGQYRAVRMTIDGDSSSIIWSNGTPAEIHWPRAGRITLYALVQPAFAVTDPGTDIVLDFDVGLSFQYNVFGLNQFEFTPWLRAVNRAATGSIAGTITTSHTGATVPAKDALITVSLTSTSSIVATGHTDSTGYYKIAFLAPATYWVSVTEPDNPFVATVGTAGVQVAAGATTDLSVSLPPAGMGNAYIHISGPTNVGVGGFTALVAAVVDSNGNTVANPNVTWTSSDTTVAITRGFGAADTTYGRSAGAARIIATSMGMSDSLAIIVADSSSVDTIASVTITPSSANVSVGDSVNFYATVRNSSGGVLSGRPIAWFVSDTTIVRLYPFGSSAFIRPLRAGSAAVQATSEGKWGTASVTVH